MHGILQRAQHAALWLPEHHVRQYQPRRRQQHDQLGARHSACVEGNVLKGTARLSKGMHAMRKLIASLLLCGQIMTGGAATTQRNARQQAAARPNITGHAS